jgi:hypothetical protein
MAVVTYAARDPKIDRKMRHTNFDSLAFDYAGLLPPYRK